MGVPSRVVPPAGGARISLIRVKYLTEPHSAKIILMSGNGVWIDSLEVAAAIQRVLAGVGHNAVPANKQFIQGRTIMFVPYEHVEWVLSDSVLEVLRG